MLYMIKTNIHLRVIVMTGSKTEILYLKVPQVAQWSCFCERVCILITSCVHTGAVTYSSANGVAGGSIYNIWKSSTDKIIPVSFHSHFEVALKGGNILPWIRKMEKDKEDREDEEHRVTRKPVTTTDLVTAT